MIKTASALTCHRHASYRETNNNSFRIYIFTIDSIGTHMLEDLSDREYSAAIVHVKDKCNLRCKHCLYFREEHDSREMEADAFSTGLRLFKKRHLS